MSNVFIFGYGSLINRESRAQTGKAGEAIPVIVNGLERSWNAVITDLNMTAVGVRKNRDTYLNGVVFSVDEEELLKFTGREVGFSMEEVRPQYIRIIGNNHTLPDGKFFTYVPQRTAVPTLKNPIVQSYIDVIIKGCLDIGRDLGTGKEFARDFIDTTFGWNGVWINDRKKPRYEKPIGDTPIKQIDSLLEAKVSQEFRNRRGG